ncbi:hypothetical protein GCM10017779_26110 [Streptomyces capillispiralis]|nr:hypothetical protein GCM10017779_26110 [Streptomyces capillispiralis]
MFGVVTLPTVSVRVLDRCLAAVPWTEGLATRMPLLAARWPPLNVRSAPRSWETPSESSRPVLRTSSISMPVRSRSTVVVTGVSWNRTCPGLPPTVRWCGRDQAR